MSNYFISTTYSTLPASPLLIKLRPVTAIVKKGVKYIYKINLYKRYRDKIIFTNYINKNFQ